MKRPASLVSLALLTCASVFISSTGAISFAKSANTPGTACKKLGSTAKSGVIPVKCVKSGKKLVWKKTSTAKPSATKTAQPSTTPSAVSTGTLPAAQSAYAINVKAVEWSWSFTYLLDGTKSPLISDSAHARVLYLPQGKSVHFSLNSGDVSHGFWIPGLSIDKEASPDAGAHFEFTADKLGTYPGMCNIQCGRGHATMTFSVVVVTQTEYLKYLSTLKSS